MIQRLINIQTYIYKVALIHGNDGKGEGVSDGGKKIIFFILIFHKAQIKHFYFIFKFYFNFQTFSFSFFRIQFSKISKNGKVEFKVFQSISKRKFD